MMANITRKPNGTFLIRVSNGMKNGRQDLVSTIYKPPVGSTSAMARKAAEKYAVLFEELVHSGGYEKKQAISREIRARRRMTIEQFVQDYYYPSIQKHLSPTTCRTYELIIDSLILPSFGRVELEDVNSTHIQSFVDFLSTPEASAKGEHGLSPASVKRYSTVFSSIITEAWKQMLLHEIMEYALKEKMILSNPTNGTTIPKIDPTELMVLDEKQLKIFISAIQSNEQWRDFFYLEIMTGLRRGEICALKWSDFDIVERKLHVNRSVTPHGAIGKAKTCYSERVIKLPYSVYQVLVNRKTSAQSEWMFPQPKDLSKPITGESALRQLKVILKSSGLPNIRFHDLRHTFATHAVSAGIDPKTLSSILGHSKASFSLDRYTAFPFQISHETGYACFRRYLYQHMNMIRAHFCFDDRYFFPFAQFP